MHYICISDISHIQRKLSCQLWCDAIGDDQREMEWPQEDARGSDVS